MSFVLPCSPFLYSVYCHIHSDTYRGMLFDVRQYSTVLTEAEIKTLYNGGWGGQVVTIMTKVCPDSSTTNSPHQLARLICHMKEKEMSVVVRAINGTTAVPNGTTAVPNQQKGEHERGRLQLWHFTFQFITFPPRFSRALT